MIYDIYVICHIAYILIYLDVSGNFLYCCMYLSFTFYILFMNNFNYNKKIIVNFQYFTAFYIEILLF